MSKEQNILASDGVFAGETKQLQFSVTDSADSPQTMTGWTLEFVIRTQVGATTALLTKTTASGIAIANGAGTNDRATVTLTAANTTAVGAGTFSYALRRSDSGSEQVLAYGSLVIRQAATR